MLLSEIPERTQTERDAKIIDHVGLYQLTIAHAVRRLYFPAYLLPNRDEALKRAGDTLSALVRQKKLAVHKFPGGLKYYTLPAKKPGTEAVDYDLATLWLSAMGESRYRRLLRTDLKQLFEKPPHHHVRHVVADEVGGPMVLRVYPTATDLKQTLASIKRHVQEARKKFRPQLEAGDYGFAVICETESKAADVQAELERKRPGTNRLINEAMFLVTTAPTSKTVTSTLKHMAKEQNHE